MGEYDARWKRRIHVAIVITTRCSRACPYCCLKHIRRDDLVESPETVADYMRKIGGGVERFYLTGGEPTVHPQFAEVLRAARDATRERNLWIYTNGAHLVQHAEATALLDGVIMTIYDEKSNAGSQAANGHIIEAYLKLKPPHVDFCARRIDHLEQGVGRGVCSRWLSVIGVLRGRVYPCCGFSGDSTELSEGWIDRLHDLKPKCGDCVYAV